MKKRKLPNVTLIGIDCLDLGRLALAAEICQRNFEFAEVKLLSSLPAKGYPNVIEIEPVLTIGAYSTFMVAEVYHYVDTSHMLVIQHDGFILNPAAWDDEFMKFDYIGAPWRHLGPAPRVGNGGFSLRSKTLMELAALKFKESETRRCHPEDLWICRDMASFFKSYGMQFAPPGLAAAFSFEANMSDWVLRRKWNGQFGFHRGVWRTNISKWLDANPGYTQDFITGRLSRK